VEGTGSAGAVGAVAKVDEVDEGEEVGAHGALVAGTGRATPEGEEGVKDHVRGIVVGGEKVTGEAEGGGGVEVVEAGEGGKVAAVQAVQEGALVRIRAGGRGVDRAGGTGHTRTIGARRGALKGPRARPAPPIARRMTP